MIDGLLNQVPNQTLQKYDVPIYDVKYDVTVFLRSTIFRCSRAHDVPVYDVLSYDVAGLYPWIV